MHVTRRDAALQHQYNYVICGLNSDALKSDALRDIAYALILSHTYYCNSLYAGLLAVMIQRLQGLIRTAARVVSGRSSFSHVSDFIRNDLHWLIWS